MAKEKKESIIAFELERFDKIIKRYQDYLDKNNILLIEDPKVRHSEMDMQVKVITALPNWLSALEKLRSSEDAKPMEMRGESEASGLMKIKQQQ